MAQLAQVPKRTRLLYKKGVIEALTIQLIENLGENAMYTGAVILLAVVTFVRLYHNINKQVGHLETRITEMNESIAQIKNHNQQQDSQHNRRKNEIDNLSQRMEKQEAKLSEICKDLAVVQESLTHITKTLNKIDGNFESFRQVCFKRNDLR